MVRGGWRVFSPSLCPQVFGMILLFSEMNIAEEVSLTKKTSLLKEVFYEIFNKYYIGILIFELDFLLIGIISP